MQSQPFNNDESIVRKVTVMGRKVRELTLEGKADSHSMMMIICLGGEKGIRGTDVDGKQA